MKLAFKPPPNPQAGCHESAIPPDVLDRLVLLGHALGAYLVLLMQGDLLATHELAEALHINGHTAARYLRRMVEIGVAEPGEAKGSYAPLEGIDADQLIRIFQAAWSKVAGPSGGDPQPPSNRVKNARRNGRSVKNAPASGGARLAPRRRRQVKNPPHPPQDVKNVPGPHAQNCHPARQNAQNVPGRQEHSPPAHAAGARVRKRHVKNARPRQLITTTDINLMDKLKDSETTVRADPNANNARAAPPNQPGGDEEIWRELLAAGIRPNDRTRALVRQPHMSAAYVRAQRLKLEQRGKSGSRWAGLLVTILEGGEGAQLNENGHLAECECTDCYRIGLIRSWSKFGAQDWL